MLPDNELSTTPAPNELLGANAFAQPFPLRDLTNGAEKLFSTPELGMWYQVWTCEVIDEEIIISAPNSAPIVWHTAVGITRVRFAFDLAMYPYVVFVQNGEFKMIWQNRNTEQKEVISLGSGTLDAQITIDETRQHFAQASDVILSYLKNGNLYYRQQRDLFQVERLLAAGEFLSHTKSGMTKGNRMQFEMSRFVDDYID